MKEKIKKATTEEVQKKNSSKTQDREEELKVKRNQLKDKKARLEGGFAPSAGRDLLAVDIEIERMEKSIEMREIQVRKDAPNPALVKYTFENDDRWRELKKWFETKEIEGMKKHLEKIKEQKEEVKKDIPKLKKRINELEKELGKEITKFKDV